MTGAPVDRASPGGPGVDGAGVGEPNLGRAAMSAPGVVGASIGQEGISAPGVVGAIIGQEHMSGHDAAAAARTAPVPLIVGPPVPAWLRELTGETLVELLDRAVGRWAERSAYVMARGRRLERWTYLDLAQRSRQVAETLFRRGVGAGTRVVTWASNDPWLVASYFAIWRLGATVVPLDLRMATDVAVRIGRQTQPIVVLAGPEVVSTAARELGAPVLALNREGLVSEGGRLTLLLPDVSPDDLAEILFTSGTTSDPKGVALTHRQVVHTGRALTLAAGRQKDRALGVIPLSHMYGQTLTLLHGLTVGSQVTFLERLAPAALFEAIRRDRVTVIIGVPQLLRVLLEGIEAEAARGGRSALLTRLRRIAVRMPMPARRLIFRRVHRAFGGSLRTITSGGARLSADLQLAWEAMGIQVIQGYGTTECAAIAAHGRRSRRIGSVGQPLADIELALGRDTELLVRGPNLMLGYWNRPADTAALMAEGWFHTGDAAQIGPDREVVILGRTRDRIALPNGLKVYPEDVETVLLEAGELRAAVVLEAPPGRLTAVLVPADLSVADEPLKDAVARANRILAPHQRVDRWLRWPGDDLPRTHTLKVRRPVVADWVATIDRIGLPRVGSTSDRGVISPPFEGSGGPIASSARGALIRATASLVRGGSPDTLARLVEILGEVFTAAGRTWPVAIDGSTSIDDLGLDSLERVALALRVEEALGASLDDEEVATAPDLATLAEIIAARRGRPPPPEPSLWAFSRGASLIRQLLDRLLTGPLLGMIARPHVEGLDLLSAVPGPVLICPNHASHLDAPLVRALLPATLRNRTAIAAAEDYFFAGSALGPIAALLTGAFPFGRTAHVRASLGRVARFIADGWSVMIFPEGTRSPSGEMGEFSSGIGLLATELDVPIVPVHVSGTYEILPKGRLLPRRRGRVRLRFGRPITLPEGEPVAAATSRVEAAVRALADDRRA